MNIPNLLTLLRLALTPFIALKIYSGDCRDAVVLLAISAFTDAADGFIARRFNQATRLGAYLDPIADKLLLVTLYIGLAGSQIPYWLTGLVVGRDILILAMAGTGMLLGHRNFPPSVWGKVSTVIQLVTGLSAVGGCAIGRYMVPHWMIWLTAAATAWSGVHYVARGVVALRTRARSQDR